MSYLSIFVIVKKIIVLFIFSFVFTRAVQAQEDQRAQFSLQPMDYSSLGFGLGFYPNGVYKIESSFGFIKSGILINAAYLGASSQRKGKDYTGIVSWNDYPGDTKGYGKRKTGLTLGAGYLAKSMYFGLSLGSMTIYEYRNGYDQSKILAPDGQWFIERKVGSELLAEMNIGINIKANERTLIQLGVIASTQNEVGGEARLTFLF